MKPKGSKEYDCAEILEIIIEGYEEKNYQIEDPDPIEVIKYSMEEAGMTQTELGRIIGDRIKRRWCLIGTGLVLATIRNLHDRLKIPLDVLIKDYPLAVCLLTVWLPTW